jgi:hypothetical protein
MYLLYIFPSAPYTYDFIVLTSLTHQRKILWFVLQTTRPHLWKTQRHISTLTYTVYILVSQNISVLKHLKSAKLKLNN